jgi:hypothetical protein
MAGDRSASTGPRPAARNLRTFRSARARRWDVASDVEPRSPRPRSRRRSAAPDDRASRRRGGLGGPRQHDLGDDPLHSTMRRAPTRRRKPWAHARSAPA